MADPVIKSLEEYIDYICDEQSDQSKISIEDEEQDDDSSDSEYGCRALAFDPNQLSNSSSLPVNGHDFLKLVQEERDKLPPVSCVAPQSLLSKKSSHPSQTSPENQSQTLTNNSATKNSGQQKATSNNHLNMSTGLLKDQVRLKNGNSDQGNRDSNKYEDLVYRDEIINNFRQLRKKIDDIREKIPKRPTDFEEGQLNEKQFEKCISRSERRVNSLLKIMSIGHPPELSTLLRKSQLEIHLTLERLADQCERTPNYSTLHADWIYSLIASLREPIEPDICSTLRRLAKICIGRRNAHMKRLADVSIRTGNEQKSHNNETETRELVNAIEDEEFASCLLIICIVRHYFGQADLR